MEDVDGFDDALALGTGYALYRHGQDALAARLEGAIERAVDQATSHLGVGLGSSSRPRVRHERVEPVNFGYAPFRTWDGVIGQEGVKAQLQSHVASAGVRRDRIPHLLLRSVSSGMGRRTLVRVMARGMKVRLVELAAPFDLDTLVAAIECLESNDLLLIDDLDRACHPGGPGATTLTRLLDREQLASSDGELCFPADITVIATTAAAEDVPAAVADRFTVHVHMERYSDGDLARLTVSRAYARGAGDLIDAHVAAGLALSAATPRDVDELVVLARDLSLALGRPVTADEVLHLRC